MEGNRGDIMADLQDTYVVHCAQVTCSEGMRGSVIVLQNTHGIYLKQMPMMTVSDCIENTNIINFGGCYSMENPSTQKAAEEVQKKVEEECPDGTIDKIGKFFCKKKKKEEVSVDNTGELKVLGECCLNLCMGQEWNYGKEQVEADGAKPLLGGAKLYCVYGGEIEIITSGQPEEGA